MRRISFLALALLAPRLQPLAAQSAAPQAPGTWTIVSDTVEIVQQQGEARPLVIRPGVFQRSDAWLAAGFALGAAGLFPLDRQIASQFQAPAVQSNTALNTVAIRFEKMTSPGAYYAGGGLYLVGKLAGMPRLADLGLHATESVLLAEGVGYVLKRTIGRARPYVSSATDPRDFSFGTGFGTGDRRSLPSGHTYTAFAVASAVTSEMSAWLPGKTWLVAPVMYGGATMVGLSRMYHNQHWASDIVLGAAVGTFSGLKLVRFMHREDRGSFREGRGSFRDGADASLLRGSPMVARDQDGTKLGWRLEF